MQLLVDNSEAAAYLIARLFLGFLFFFQGYDAVFKVKIKNVIATFDDQFESKGIPRWLTALAAWFTSLAELFCGALLILGLMTIPSLYILGLTLLVASIGFGISTPMWDMRFVFPRLALILFLLIAPHEWNCFSLDKLIYP